MMKHKFLKLITSSWFALQGVMLIFWSLYLHFYINESFIEALAGGCTLLTVSVTLNLLYCCRHYRRDVDRGCQPQNWDCMDYLLYSHIKFGSNIISLLFNTNDSTFNFVHDINCHRFKVKSIG